MSVPAHNGADTPAHRHVLSGVTNPVVDRDAARLLADAATSPAVSDRALRVYAVAVTVYDRGVDAAQVAACVPGLTEGQASRLLGRLVTAGFLEKRLRTVGYKAGDVRIRRSIYTLTGVQG